MVPALSRSNSAISMPRSRLTPRRSREFSQSDCSLPLKKRRFFPSTDFPERNGGLEDVVDSSNMGHFESNVDVNVVSNSPEVTPVTPSTLLNHTLDKTDDERMAALALISASSFMYASIPEPDSPSPVSRPLQKDIHDDSISAAIAITYLSTPRSQDTTRRTISVGHFQPLPLERYNVNTVSPFPLKTPPIQRHSLDSSMAPPSFQHSLSSSEDEEGEDYGTRTDVDSFEESVSTSSSLAPQDNLKAANPSRLTSPLPNGCHGRTSRYNSYCRRQPCFRGSKFCKLHYSLNVIKNRSATTVRNESDPEPGSVRQ